MGDLRAKPASAIFGVAAAVMITVVLAFGLFAGWVLIQYGSKSTEFEWQARRLGEQWYVSYVAPAGNADGSLRNGDLVVAINGETLAGAPSLGLILRSIAGNSLYCMRVSRAGVISEVWLRARVRSEDNYFKERFPLMLAGALFFAAGLAMLLRWDSAPARIGFIAASVSSLRMGCWAILPVTGFFEAAELHAYYLFWLPVGLALPATLHALLRFSEREPPGRIWWTVCSIFYLLWGTGGFTIISSGAVPAPVPEGVAYVYWDHVSYGVTPTLFTIGLPLLLLATVGACAIRMRQLLRLNPEGDIHRRLLWLLTGGILFALPMVLMEGATWLGVEYNLASSWLSSLTAICAAYALATESVSTPAMVLRGIAGALVPGRWFRGFDQKHFPESFAVEETLRAALDRIQKMNPGSEWRPVVSEALKTAFGPVTVTFSENLAPGQLIDLGGKASGDNYTRRERILVDQIEDAVLSLLQKKTDTRLSGGGSAGQKINLLRECPKCGKCYDNDVVRCESDEQMPVLTLPVERVIDGKYRLERLLGRGGMGSVYAARDLRLDRRVAVKIMLSELFGHHAALKRFEREARVAAKLSHPNIIQIFDFGAIGTMGAYQVMELVVGRSWRSEIENSGAIPIPEVLTWIEQLLDGIQAAHEAGVIHRDLKPENLVLVERGGSPPLVKILDFGLAKMNLLDLSREERLSIGVTTIGTIGYVPPEQLTGGVTDQRSDIYAIGRILIETLTGSLPGESEPELDPLLKQILVRCTAHAPPHRYASISELRIDLLPALMHAAENAVAQSQP